MPEDKFVICVTLALLTEVAVPIRLPTKFAATIAPLARLALIEELDASA